MAVSLVFLIIRIALHFPALPKPFSDSLAILSITVLLILDPRIGNEMTSAGRIGTSDLFVHGFPPWRNHKPVQPISIDGRTKSEEKKKMKSRSILDLLLFLN